jgi:DNA-binding IclR family transcriptional regulator
MAETTNISLRRGHQILRLLVGRSGGLGFEEIRRHLDVSPATASRLLKAMMTEEFVEQNPAEGRYVAGSALTRLARAHLAPDRVEILRRTCRDLAMETGLSSLYCCLKQTMTGPRMVRSMAWQVPEGMNYGPMHSPDFLLAMGFGIPLLRGLDEAQLASVLAEHRQRSGQCASEVHSLVAELGERKVLVLPERLESNSVGCTRIVSAVGSAETGSLGVTAFGQIRKGITQRNLDAWAEGVRRASSALETQLERTQPL